MEKNLFLEIRKHWSYLHPLTKALTLIDYKLERFLEQGREDAKKLFSEQNLKFFYWLPRLLGLAFIIFLGSFALDVFNGYKSFSLMLDSALARLMPSLLLGVMLLIAWKEELLGGMLFLVTFLVLFALIISENPLISDLIFFGPIFVIGSLFLMDSYLRQINKH